MKTFKILSIYTLIIFGWTISAWTSEFEKIRIWNTSATCLAEQDKIEKSFSIFYQDTAQIQIYIPNVILQGEAGQIAVEFPEDLNDFADQDIDGSGIFFQLPIAQSEKPVQELTFRFSTKNKKEGSYKSDINAILVKTRELVKLGSLELQLLPLPPMRDPWMFPVLVLAVGAFLSWLMAIKVPEVRRRRGLQLKILGQRAQIDDLTRPESSLNKKLRRKTIKALELNDLAQFNAVEERIKETDEILSVCRKARNIENRIQTRDLIPMDLEEEVEKLLEEVYLNLEEENIDSANGKLNQAFEYFDKKMEKLAEFQTRLVSEIESLPSRASSKSLQDDISSLKRRAKNLNNNLDRMIELNRDFRKIELILEMEKAHGVSRELKDRITYLLTEANDFAGAKELIQIAREGLDEEYYKKLILENKIQIVIKGKPFAYNSLTFELVYQVDDGNPERINNSLLAKQKFTYDWDFDDGYSQSGKSTVHFFKKDGMYTITLIIKDPQGAPIFTSSDAVTARTKIKINKAIGVGDLKRQQMYMVKRHFADIRTLDLVAFVVSMAIATLVGLETHYVKNATFGSFQDYINLFLWGFSLDTAKNGFMSVMKGLEKGVQK